MPKTKLSMRHEKRERMEIRFDKGNKGRSGRLWCDYG